MALKENYKDDILDVSVNTKRKYRMTENQDGTISLEDETVYTQEGDSFGASDMNATNGKVNALETDIDEINDNLSGFKYYPIGTAIVGLVADDSAYTDANGNYILADSATGRGLIDNITYKSISSTEKTCGEVGADTCSPFSSDFVSLTNYTTISGEMTVIPSQNLNKFKYIVVKYGWSGDTISEDVYSSDTVNTSGLIQIFRKSDLTSYRTFSWSPINGYGYYSVKVKIDNGNFVFSTTNDELTQVKVFGL